LAVAVRETVPACDLFKSIPVEDGDQEIGWVVARDLDARLVKTKSGSESLGHVDYVCERAISADPDDQGV
jgi:hypothetical protein